ncbi:P-loop containing nucleoside triphosphate hydrolase protein [Ephemerocybe angulata]|uniref:DNA helicase n=1 Tax=Ephemerocybe angulata TaxID=980116 RepID=A0A8H6HSP1_9AGAR|nr:P-loop containing nucleoside triphosphate hydrolase protein [Tulosesus angulatus]
MASEEQLRAFITRQRELLAKERNAEIERTSLLLSNCGPKLLEQKGLALNGVGVAGVNIGLGGKTLVELERPAAYHTSPIFPPHTFRNGDLARIEPNIASTAKKPKKVTTSADAKAQQQVEGVVYRVSDTKIVIAVDPAEGSDDLDLPERCRVVKLANSVTYDRMDKAIDRLEKTVLPTGDDKWELTPLTQVLMGMKPMAEKTPVQNIAYIDPNLNDSQKEAVRFCLESPEVACIHGPPGTGKTHTLIEIIRQLTSQSDANPRPLRLLVCGASNLAVDNILERLLALPVQDKSERLKVTRIGHPARVMASEGILDATLEVKSTRTDQAALVKDVKQEIESALETLSGKGKGSKGKPPRGLERKKMWEEVKALRKEFRKREGGIVNSVLSESQVVVATCHSAGGRQLRNQDFDVVIIDEATQAIEAVCWVPIFKAKKLILAGDPLQLPPTILSLDKDRKKKEKVAVKGTKATTSTKKSANLKEAKPKASKSLPEAKEAPASPDEDDGGDSTDSDGEQEKTPPSKAPAANRRRPSSTDWKRCMVPGIKRMLQVQYRMHDQICTFPSKTLYYSKLKSHSSVASHLLRDLPNAEADEDEDEVLQAPCCVLRYVWIAAGILPSQIAIITPYQAQVTLLTSLLRPVYGPSLEIGTVDGMQGREKEAIVISMVRSNDTREVGFLKEKRRMNVAMTRARRHLCVIGDASTVVHGGSYLKKWLAWLEANADVRYAGLD